MAVNFKMDTHKKEKKRMIIRMSGDFDGNSAWELVHKLVEQSGKFDVVELDTHGLKKMLPFGRNVFLSQAASLKKTKTPFLVSGPYADDLTGPGMFLAKRSVTVDK
ncbi:MAG: hypothetical protein WC799_19645 [Desulfobacteraceae bacterium]|jgi:hypothetical protein